METRDLLKQYKDKVNSKINDFFDSEIKNCQNKDEKIINLIDNLKEFNLRGGKRIRAILALVSYELFDGKDFNSMLDIAVSVELMQSFFLIHDDIIDNDSFRRGGPTFHKIYENSNENLGQRQSEGIAIVAGDILESLSKKMILQSCFNEQIKIKILEKFNEIIENTCYGEFLDILSAKQQNMDEEDIIKIHKFKTAKYTIEGPLQLGAITAGADDKQLKILSDYAIPLGIAFQIKDDIMGLFGDNEKIGKPAGSDVREGKITLLILKAIEKCSEDDKNLIKSCLGNEDITEDELSKLRKIIVKTGSLDYSEKLSEKLIFQAKDALKKSSLSEQSKHLLFEIADLILKRDC
ncbi:MAG: polyprenyl synthetase family protein [Candidatus Nanoarchaeia archaeon]|nr:polyprenyl synthetase family protein [Candidatus Nanoarchaeia archaeon]